MTKVKKSKNGGFPAKIRTLPANVRKQFLKLKSRFTARKHIKNMQVKKQGLTQAEAFVQGRSATVQYAIDVLALAFILALLFTAINHLWR